MNSEYRAFRARFSAAIAAACIASLLTACGGGGTSSLPQAPTPLTNPSSPTANGDTVVLPITQSMLNSTPSYNALRYHIYRVQTNGLSTKATVFPVDVAFHGGHVLPSAQMHEVFIDATSTGVGSPQIFDANFSNSTFVHVLDQYAGSTANNRYPVNATMYSASIPLYSNVLSQDQLFAVLHAVGASSHLTGYGHMYNLFLGPNLDTCIDLTAQCYSPDNASTFVFCAYHGSITFSDIGHVIFSVIPYQHVAGCGDDFAGATLPNAVPIDDTATTLSHEESEAISDPDPGTGYYNDNFGFEIGDTCNTYRVTEALNGHKYLIQPEYANSTHGCYY